MPFAEMQVPRAHESARSRRASHVRAVRPAGSNPRCARWRLRGVQPPPVKASHSTPAQVRPVLPQQRHHHDGLARRRHLVRRLDRHPTGGCVLRKGMRLRWTCEQAQWNVTCITHPMTATSNFPCIAVWLEWMYVSTGGELAGSHTTTRWHMPCDRASDPPPLCVLSCS